MDTIAGIFFLGGLIVAALFVVGRVVASRRLAAERDDTHIEKPTLKNHNVKFGVTSDGRPFTELDVNGGRVVVVQEPSGEVSAWAKTHGSGEVGHFVARGTQEAVGQYLKDYGKYER